MSSRDVVVLCCCCCCCCASSRWRVSAFRVFLPIDLMVFLKLDMLCYAMLSLSLSQCCCGAATDRQALVSVCSTALGLAWLVLCCVVLCNFLFWVFQSQMMTGDVPHTVTQSRQHQENIIGVPIPLSLSHALVHWYRCSSFS